jgi:ParB family chromosome partitioning protein
VERGKGLRALIPTGTLAGPEPESRLEEVPVGQVLPNPFQPRKQWREAELAELVESVRAHGILQPLVARKRGRQYELIAGERRLMAARQAGLATVPMAVREATDREMLELALVENLQRESISAAEAAEAYARLINEFEMTQEEVAQRVGKSRATVSNTVRLLMLPPQVLASLRQGEIEAGHGKALLAISAPGLLVRVWRRVVRKGLSVRQTEELVTKLLGRDVPRGTSPIKRMFRLDPNLENLEYRLAIHLSTRVQLKPGETGGTIEVRYADDEELDRIFWRIVGSVAESEGVEMR